MQPKLVLQLQNSFWTSFNLHDIESFFSLWFFFEYFFYIFCEFAKFHELRLGSTSTPTTCQPYEGEDGEPQKLSFLLRCCRWFTKRRPKNETECNKIATRWKILWKKFRHKNGTVRGREAKWENHLWFFMTFFNDFIHFYKVNFSLAKASKQPEKESTWRQMCTRQNTSTPEMRRRNCKIPRLLFHFFLESIHGFSM